MTVPSDLTMNDLWNYGTAEEWNQALRQYDEKLTGEIQQLEEYIRQIQAEAIEKLSPEEFYDFLHDKYFPWKYTAKNRLATTRKSLRKYVDNGRLPELANIQHRLFRMNHANIRECLKTVTEIRGLGTAGASGLLSILFPNDFGTVDQFVVKSLEKIEGIRYSNELSKMKPESLKDTDGVILVTIFREKAEELNKKFHTDFWTPRKIDMVLWAFGR